MRLPLEAVQVVRELLTRPVLLRAPTAHLVAVRVQPVALVELEVLEVLVARVAAMPPVVVVVSCRRALTQARLAPVAPEVRATLFPR